MEGCERAQTQRLEHTLSPFITPSSLALIRFRTMTTVPVLPYDIWIHIASFITSDDLKRLMLVHRAFFHLVMYSVYREVFIYHEGEYSTNRCLNAMGPLAASYVRKLILRPHILGLNMPSKAGASLSNWWSNARNFGRTAARLDWGSSKPSSVRILMRRVHDMTQLTSLVVGCYPTDSWRHFIDAIPFLDAAWRHSPRLQHLALHLPIECFDKVLETTPHFPVLEELRLTIWTLSSHPLLCQATLITVATFINRHSSSLIHLTIDIPTPNLDPSPLFLGIEQLPKLLGAATEQSLQRLDPQEGGPVGNFLTKHQGLRELRFQFYEPTFGGRPTPSSFFSSSIFQIDFPSISSLDLGLCYWDKKFEPSLASSMAQYLSRFRHSLTKLIIRDCIISLPIIEAFVSALGERAVLRELELHVHYLSSDLLDLLAHKLPRLRDLDLTYSWLQYKEDGCWDPDFRRTSDALQSQEFLEKICINDYSSWSLRHLRVCPREIRAAQCGDVRKIMATCLPNVHTINGIPKSKFDDSQLMMITPLYFLPVPA